MAVYYHLGGLPELFQAVVDKGFQDLRRAFVDRACRATIRSPPCSRWRWQLEGSRRTIRTCTT